MKIVERSGGLVRIEGVAPWLAEASLRPCKCGERVFLVIGRGLYQRLICSKCVARKKEDVVFSRLEMPEKGREA